MKKLLIFAFIALLILPVASALDVKSYQESMDFSLTRGQTLTIPLVLVNSDDNDATGIEFTSTSSWTEFNDMSSYTVAMIYANSQYILPVEISVPGGADLGMHDIDIYASGEIISKINLDVTVGSDIAIDLEETLIGLKDATNDIDDLKEKITDLESEINSLGSTVENQIGEFTENEDYLSQLKSEKSQLEDEISSLEQQMKQQTTENNQKSAEITGMMVTGSSIGLGITIAIIVIFLLARKGLFKRLKPRRYGKTTEKDKEKFESRRPRDL